MATAQQKHKSSIALLIAAISLNVAAWGMTVAGIKLGIAALQYSGGALVVFAGIGLLLAMKYWQRHHNINRRPDSAKAGSSPSNVASQTPGQLQLEINSADPEVLADIKYIFELQDLVAENPMVTIEQAAPARLYRRTFANGATSIVMATTNDHGIHLEVKIFDPSVLNFKTIWQNPLLAEARSYTPSRDAVVANLDSDKIGTICGYYQQQFDLMKAQAQKENTKAKVEHVVDNIYRIKTKAAVSYLEVVSNKIRALAELHHINFEQLNFLRLHNYQILKNIDPDTYRCAKDNKVFEITLGESARLKIQIRSAKQLTLAELTAVYPDDLRSLRGIPASPKAAGQ